MLRSQTILLICVTLGSLITGCAHKIPSLAIDPEEKILLADTPFFPQEKYQCGPASLAMLLGESGVNVHPDDLAPLTYLPERQGSLQLELIGASRNYNRIPYEIDPEISAILAELRAEKPVLVLQNYGLKALPAYHYAVVIGAEPDKVILRSGTTKTLTMQLSEFLMTWLRAGSWGIILLKPGELPARLDGDRYVRAVNSYEKSGNVLAAERAYLAALSPLPDHPALLFALGNNYMQQQKFMDAEIQFRRILRKNPADPAALNNLADILAKQDCFDQAAVIIDRGVMHAKTQKSPLLPIILQTREEIDRFTPGLMKEKHLSAYSRKPIDEITCRNSKISEKL